MHLPDNSNFFFLFENRILTIFYKVLNNENNLNMQEWDISYQLFPKLNVVIGVVLF